MLIPEIILFNTIEAFVQLVTQDYANASDKTQTILNDLFNVDNNNNPLQLQNLKYSHFKFFQLYIIMLRGYKYELNLNNNQKTYFNKNFGCCRFVYNWCLALRIRWYENYNKTMHVNDMINIMTRLKRMNNYKWLQEVDSQALIRSVRNLDVAFSNFFRKKKNFPNFKNSSNRQSCQFSQDIYVDFKNQKIKLPKIGWIKFFLDREFNGEIRSATVSRLKCGKYIIGILVENGKNFPEKKKITSKNSIGIDVGLKTFATFSNGEKIDNPKHFGTLEEKLKKLQRRHSRSKKGSVHREKLRSQIAKLYYRITCQRKDFLHKLSSRIVSENQTIIIEDLNIQGMVQNHSLAKSINEVGWSEFFRQLTYKCDWYGKNLIKIGRFDPSSKICNNCGYHYKDLELNMRQWICESCGTTHDRDLNAAINIKKFGLQRQNLISVVKNNSDRGTVSENVESRSIDRATKR